MKLSTIFRIYSCAHCCGSRRLDFNMRRSSCMKQLRFAHLFCKCFIMIPAQSIKICATASYYPCPLSRCVLYFVTTLSWSWKICKGNSSEYFIFFNFIFVFFIFSSYKHQVPFIVEIF